MITHARLALLAVPLLVAGSVAGVLLAGGALDNGAVFGSSEAPSDDRCSVADFAFPDDASVETWSGDVPADASGGTLEVQAHHGGVDVATWDKDAWKVEVAEVDSQDQLEPQVSGSVEDGVFSLSVAIEDDSRQEVGPFTTSVTVGEEARAHVRVRVPSAAYDAVEVDSRPDENNSVDVDLSLSVPDDPTAPGNHTHNPVLVQDLEAATLSADGHDRDVAVAGIEADEVAASSHDEEAVAAGVEADALTVASHDGDACAKDVDAAETTLDSHDGDVVGAVEAADLTATSHDGEVVVGLVPSDSGSATAGSHDGDVTLRVATGDDYAYDASASSHDGDVTIDLPNATVVEDGEEDEDGGSASARTQGYDNPVQVDLTANSHEGDVTVTGR